MVYPFKRDFYFDVEKMLEKTRVIFILGPRKCGKTVCLTQLNDNLSNTEYINFKTIEELQSVDVFDEIINSINTNEDKIYLLDEITYALKPEIQIYKVAQAYTETNNKNTKVIFTGSQSVALSSWGHRAFAASAGFIKPNFLTYNEWLRFKNLKEVSERTYEEYLFGVSDFYNFTTLEDYLKGCLDETILSNSNTDNYLFGNDCYLLDTDILLDICYTTLFTLHNQISAQTFAKADKLTATISVYFSQVCTKLDNIGDMINASFVKKYTNFRTKNLETIKQALLFLYQCDLITITPVSDNFDDVFDVMSDLSHDSNRINYKDELFKKYNTCIKYPLFYVAILQDILKDKMPDTLPRVLLGSIIECQIRGLLSDNTCFEYHDNKDREIDYVNIGDNYAVEMTISNKNSDELNFYLLPDNYISVLLTRDVTKREGRLLMIPYYDFIYKISSKGVYDLLSDTNNSSLRDMNLDIKTKK